MVEEQATLADLQKIADEVSEAFHRRPWKVVLREVGESAGPFVYRRRIYISRPWFEKNGPANLQEFLVWQCAFEQCLSKGAVFGVAWGLSVLFMLSLPFLSRDMSLGGALSVRSWGITVLALLLLPLYWLLILVRRLPNSDVYLNRLLEVVKDPEAARKCLEDRKVSPETLAKFEAIVAAKS